MAETPLFPQLVRAPRGACARTWRTVAATVLALVAAGCSTIVPRGAAPVGVAPPPPRAPVIQGGTLPQDEARHRVALLVPMTGPNAAVGQAIANSANLAVLDTGGKRVRITTYDTGPGAAAAAARAITDGNRLFLGPLLADDVRAVAAPARAAGVPVIAFSNDAGVAGNGVYLMGFSPAQAIVRVVRYARSQGVQRFAGLVPTGLYGRNASTALIHAVDEADGKVVALQTYEHTPRSIAAALAKFPKDQHFDALLVADGGRVALGIAPLVRRSSSPQARLLGTELWATEPALATNPALAGAWYAAVPEGMYRQLGVKYRARYGKAPYRLGSLGYDAVLLAVRIASDWQVGAPFPTAALTERGGFAGVDGAFRFGRDGIAERTLEVRQFGAGGGTTVSTASRGFAPGE